MYAIVCSAELYPFTVEWKRTGWLLWFWEFGLAVPVPTMLQYIQCQLCIFYTWSSVRTLQRESRCSLVSSCELIDTALHLTHCVQCALCKRRLFCALHAPPHVCCALGTLQCTCWLLWFCVGGKKLGKKGQWRRTPPHWFTTQLFHFVFAPLYSVFLYLSEGYRTRTPLIQATII